jgi:hypothetical protein
MLKYLVLLSPLLVGARGDFVLVERRDSPPPGFSRIGSAPANDVLNMRLALAQGNIEGLHDTVYEISTPGSSRYGQYLTAAEARYDLWYEHYCSLITRRRSHNMFRPQRRHSPRSTPGLQRVISLHRPLPRPATGSAST